MRGVSTGLRSNDLISSIKWLKLCHPILVYQLIPIFFFPPFFPSLYKLFRFCGV